MRRHRAPLGLAALVLVLGLPALARYGVTWDEALGDFFFGERYLSFFLSFDRRYLDFAADPYPAGRVPDLSVSPFRDRPWEYYPVANALAAASSRLLSGRLGWLDPFDGFHAVNLFLGAILAAALYVFVRRRFDATAALASCVLLFTAPRIVAHLCSNVKDPPEMALFALTIFAFAAAYERGSTLGLAGAGVLWGLALGTKANALFLPAVVLVAIAVGRRPERWRGRTATLVAALSAGAAAGLLTVLALWPYLWGAPLERAREHLEYIGLRLFATRPESIQPPLEAIAFTTPLPFLALAAAGAGIALRELRGRDPRFVLPLAWITVVLVRLHLPGAVNFDGVRHFLELFPPLAILGGVAASRLAGVVRGVAATTEPETTDRRRLRRAAAAAVLALLLAPAMVAVLRVHPFELAYWNALAGGLDGARAKRLAQAGDYWATSYRAGLEWLNAHAPEDAALAVPIAQHAVRLVAPLRLRSDIGLLDLARPELPELRPGTLQILEQVASERPVYVMFVLRDDWTNELVEDCRARLDPLVRWTVDGAPILLVYRWTPPA
ncbi:MAG TPA: glycosyltransferase family 39 protein [Thermoanaerobaculia bacterium]|nr:glycosyltransferase family 39 protein [Thermoanaerobaculia bacterium]